MISKSDDLIAEPPLNREPDLKELVSSFITAKNAYNRNHSAIPVLEAASHTVTVDGDVETPLDLSVASLRDDLPQHEVVCALQCAGNRRHTMRTKLKEVSGVDWLDGAVMNCRWKGPRLRDVLLRAGLKVRDPEDAGKASSSSMHVAFACHQRKCQDDEYYGGSIELWRAMRMDREVILALEMNGKPLSPAYGYPVRVVVPGVAGARWVKWLDRITVQDTESPNFYQQHDYKVLPPEALTWEIAEKYWGTVPAIQCMPINSVVAVPNDDDTAQRDGDGYLTVRGYSIPRGDQGPVVRVQVSGDDGNSWIDARLLRHPSESKWCWTLWEARLRVDKGPNRTIYSRATDMGGNTQPKFAPWNLRGVNYNGYGASWNVTVV